MHRQISGTSQLDNAEFLNQIEKGGNLALVASELRYEILVLHINNLGPKQLANLNEF